MLRVRAVVLFILVSYVSGCLSPDAQTKLQSVDGAIGEVAPITSFAWESADVRGDIAGKITIVATSETTCRFRFNATGTIDAPGHGYFYALLNHEPRPYMTAGTESQFNLPPPVWVRAHAAIVDETQHNGRFPARWLASEGREVTVGGPDLTAEFVFAGKNLEPLGPDAPSYEVRDMGNDTLRLGLTCEAPFDITTIEASREATIFHEGSLEGGAGVHWGDIGTSGATVLDSRGLAIASEAGFVAVSVHGDLLLNHVGAGLIEINYPGGSDMFLDHPSQVLAACAVTVTPACPLNQRIFQAGTGDYRVRATYASAHITSELEGAILGFSPIEDLDALESLSP